MWGQNYSHNNIKPLFDFAPVMISCVHYGVFWRLQEKWGAQSSIASNDYVLLVCVKYFSVLVLLQILINITYINKNSLKSSGIFKNIKKFSRKLLGANGKAIKVLVPHLLPQTRFPGYKSCIYYIGLA